MLKDQSVAVIDFDGTLIRGDLGRDFVQWLIQTRRVGTIYRFATVPLGVLNSLLRHLCATPFCNRFLQRFSSDALDDLADCFLDERMSTYLENKALFDFVGSVACQRVVLTGSPELLVQKFLSRAEISIFDVVIGQRPGRLRWMVNPTPFGRFKPRFVQLPIELAVADSYSDRFLLRKAQRAVVISGDRRLEQIAQRYGWEISRFNSRPNERPPQVN